MACSAMVCVWKMYIIIQQWHSTIVHIPVARMADADEIRSITGMVFNRSLSAVVING
jgi:hypothetical protein